MGPTPDAPADRRFYFVRHGESVFNAQKLHQHAEVELSEKGKEQAKIVARRFTKLPVDRIVASSHTRAHQTAQIVGDVLGKPVETSPLFGELRRPTALVGKHADDPYCVQVRAEIDAHWHEESWHHSDEENCADLRQRAVQALQYLLQRPAGPSLVVTHGGILAGMVAVMMFGESATSHELLALKKFLWTSNTGITICDYLAKGRWRLVTFNDYAHLG